MSKLSSGWLIGGALLSTLVVLLEWVLLSSGAVAYGPDATRGSIAGYRRPANRPAIVAGQQITYSHTVLLPLALKDAGRPEAPSMEDIRNADCDGYYAVDWSEALRAEGYVLEEKPYQDWPPDFSWGWLGAWGLEVVYEGADTSWDVPPPGKLPGTYLYRVRGHHDAFGYGAYSNIEAVTVVPPPTPTFAAVVAQLNTPTKLSNHLRSAYQFTFHSGCVSYWPEEFYNLRKGDCKDYATFASYVLARHGFYAEIVSFKLYFENGTNDGHVVVVYRDVDGRLRYMSNGKIEGEVTSISDLLSREAQRANATVGPHIVLPAGTINVCSPE